MSREADRMQDLINWHKAQAANYERRIKKRREDPLILIVHTVRMLRGCRQWLAGFPHHLYRLFVHTDQWSSLIVRLLVG